MQPGTLKLITFANYSNPSSSSRIIPCFIPPKDNTELKSAFAQYDVNTSRIGSLGKQRTSKSLLPRCNLRPRVVFENNSTYGGSLGQK